MWLVILVFFIRENIFVTCKQCRAVSLRQMSFFLLHLATSRMWLIMRHHTTFVRIDHKFDAMTSLQENDWTAHRLVLRWSPDWTTLIFFAEYVSKDILQTCLESQKRHNDPESSLSSSNLSKKIGRMNVLSKRLLSRRAADGGVLRCFTARAY